MRVIAYLLPALLALSACARPVPPERADYVGFWRSESVELRILPEGRVEYRKSRGNSSTSINAPIKSFSGDDFNVGVGPFTTTFHVSQAPHQVDGRWMMTVDGELLVRDR